MATNAAVTAETDALKSESGDKIDESACPLHLHDHHLHHEASHCAHPIEHVDGGHFLLPSPIPSRRNRSASAAERGATAPVNHGKVKHFCREKGHGFIVPNNGGEDVFLHVSDIDGDTVPKAGDEVIYKTILMPPKMEKLQAVHVQIIAMKPVKHEHWEDTSDLKE
ncbi:putative Cold shock domain-containing protein [Hypsibius exemplaris]|uniref:Cold shock domain-containing protein n=1 Tax=Hypsibius exemplaris TaxID=2072580 RepID=A0A9X6RKW9_HYPEX|nr:putative Cold shock domain-containing protein [Hypsibius exemplaris]